MCERQRGAVALLAAAPEGIDTASLARRGIAAATLKRLSDAGLDGIALASVNYVQEMPVIRNELLPRLERLGLRKPLH